MLKKKILSLLLIFSMVLATLPATSIIATASGNGEITVNVTVINKGTIANGKNSNLMMNIPMTIPEGSSVIDAVKAAHEQFHPDGASAYDVAGISFNKFWGIVTYNCGYALNGVFSSDPENDTVSNGDYLDLLLYADWSTDVYADFDTRTYEVAGGEPVNIKLSLTDVFGTPKSSSEAKLIYSNDGALPSIDSGKTTNQAGSATLHFPSAGTYNIMATIDGTVVNSSIATVVVTSDEANPQSVIASDMDALTFDDIKDGNTSSNSVTSNMKLPTIGESGKTNITWSSSHTNIISNTGIVNRPPNTGTDETVRLTATFAYAGTTSSKYLDVTVPKFDKSNAEVIQEVINALNSNTQLKDGYTATEWAGENAVDTNIITKIEELIKSENGSVTVNDTVTLEASQTAITADGTITYGSTEVSGNVTFTLSFGGTEKTYTLKVIIPEKTPSKQDAYNADWLTFDDIKGENTDINNITANLLLPREDPEDFYTAITWSANTGAPDYLPTDAISIDTSSSYGPYVATIIRPGLGEPDAVVSLNASIEGGLYWDFGMAPPGPTPQFPGWKGFTITIPAVTQAEVDAAQLIVDEAIKLYTLDNITVRGTTDKADLNDLDYHINNIPLNWTYVDDLADFKESYRDIQVEWTTTNPGFKDGKISSGAEVIRTASDQIGKIKLTLSYNGATAVKEWDTTINAWTDADTAAENDILTNVKNSLDFDVIKDMNTSSTAVTSDLELIEGATVAADGSIVFDTSTVYHEKGANISWTSSNEKIVKESWTELKITQPVYDTKVTLTATLTSPMYSTMIGVTSPTKDITITVAGKYGEKIAPADIISPITNSALGYVDANNENKTWLIADLIAVGHTFTTDEKDELAEELIKEVKSIEDIGVLAKYTVALSALGYDASNITYADGTTLNIPAKLIAGSSKDTLYFTLPYVLIALQQNDNYATDAQIDDIKEWIIDQKAGWMSTSFGTDSMTPVILALSPYYNEASVKTLLDDAVVELKKFQQERGALYATGSETYGASSTGLGIAALVSLGIDPATVTNATSGASLVDGLTSYYDATSGKFAPTVNSFSTDQGFRGLIAATNYSASGYNIYDFSAVAKESYKEDINITFVTNGGNSISTQTIANGAKATEPMEPTKANYIFDGWYENSNFTGTAFDFANQSVVENTTLYAKWLTVANVLEGEQNKIENLDSGDPANKTTINTAAKDAVEAVKNSGKEAVRNDSVALDYLASIEKKFLEANGITVEQKLPVINSDVADDDRIPEKPVEVIGLGLSALALDGSFTEIQSIRVDVTQSASSGNIIVLDIVPIAVDTSGRETPISNDQLISPVTLKIYLNDGFEANKASVLHKFTGGGQETLETPVMTDADGNKYIEITVTQFSEFEISAIAASINAPFTGDTSSLMFPSIIMIISLAGIALIIYRRKSFK